MKYSRIRRYRRQHRYFGALVLRNPILALGLDLPFVIAASVSLRNAVAMSIELFIIHVVTMFSAIYTRRDLPLWSKAAVNAGVATLAMVAARALLVELFPGILNSLGIYMYLLAINGMTQFQANALDRREKPWSVMSGAFSNALGFSLTVLAVSVLREAVGSGTLWGMALPLPFKLSALLLPFSGFILVGFLLALFKFISKRWTALAILETARREARFTSIGRRGDRL